MSKSSQNKSQSYYISLWILPRVWFVPKSVVFHVLCVGWLLCVFCCCCFCIFPARFRTAIRLKSHERGKAQLIWKLKWKMQMKMKRMECFMSVKLELSSQVIKDVKIHINCLSRDSDRIISILYLKNDTSWTTNDSWMSQEYARIVAKHRHTHTHHPHTYWMFVAKEMSWMEANKGEPHNNKAEPTKNFGIK